MERRTINSELRVAQEGDAPKIAGYAAVFNSASDPDLPWKESVDPHAFDSVLASGPDARCLLNHNEDHVLGRTKSGTLRLSVDARGLRYECDPPDTQVARDLMTSMKRGDIDQSSYGFIVDPDGDDWSQDADGNVIRRIKGIRRLSDVSVVTFPAFPEASAGVRSLPESMPVEYRSLFEARRKTHTKEVDGENLTADDFLIVVDPQKTDTWNLPWHFSTEEKTESHLRDALARFDQVEGVSAEVKAEAYAKLKKLCVEHGIKVTDDEKKSLRALLPDQCICTCSQCRAGQCGICSADPQCVGAERNSITIWREKTLFELSL